jgi:hypothetical protein
MCFGEAYCYHLKSLKADLPERIFNLVAIKVKATLGEVEQVLATKQLLMDTMGILLPVPAVLDLTCLQVGPTSFADQIKILAAKLGRAPSEEARHELQETLNLVKDNKANLTKVCTHTHMCMTAHLDYVLGMSVHVWI